MTTEVPFVARPLDRVDLTAALALTTRVGVHGVYTGNHLAALEQTADGRELTGDESGALVALAGADDLVGLAYFGGRGNLILVEDLPLDGERVADAVRRAALGWRIALGPAAALEALARHEARPPLVHRRQIYYGVRPAAAGAPAVTVRLADKRDQAWLLQAALELNEEDLCIDRQRVQRSWLRDAIRRRIRREQTHVIGESGRPLAKLDIGSTGPSGLVLEGVFTAAEARGKGLAAGLVAEVARRSSAPLVCLHVAEGNVAARRAYENAGMEPLGECSLMLRG
ncbi:MAG: GNAT family N-acetyltransferase [Planctomycetota bacterium]